MYPITRTFYVIFDYDPIDVIAYPIRRGALGKNLHETRLEIDGRQAFMFVLRPPACAIDRITLRTYLPNRHVKLRMLISCSNPARLRTAETILRSIQFPEKRHSKAKSRGLPGEVREECGITERSGNVLEDGSFQRQMVLSSLLSLFDSAELEDTAWILFRSNGPPTGAVSQKSLEV